MKNIFIVLFLFIEIVSFGQIKISELPEAISINNSDIYLTSQGTVSKKVQFVTFKNTIYARLNDSTLSKLFVINHGNSLPSLAYLETGFANRHDTIFFHQKGTWKSIGSTDSTLMASNYSLRLYVKKNDTLYFLDASDTASKVLTPTKGDLRYLKLHATSDNASLLQGVVDSTWIKKHAIETDPKFTTDSSLIKTAARTWNSSVAKKITAVDTVKWNAKMDSLRANSLFAGKKSIASYNSDTLNYTQSKALTIAQLARKQNTIANLSDTSKYAKITDFKTTTTLYVDVNRGDTYIANGSVQYPYKTISAAVTAGNVLAVPFSLEIAAGTYTDASVATIAYPVVIHANNSTYTVGSGAGTLTLSDKFSIYGLKLIGNLVQSNTSQAIFCALQNTEIYGNLTVSGSFSTLQSRVFGNGAANSLITVNSTAMATFSNTILGAQVANTYARIANSGYLLLLESELFANDNSNYALTSSAVGSTITLSTAIITNAGTGGGVNCANSATNLGTQNEIVNTEVFINGATNGITCGTAYSYLDIYKIFNTATGLAVAATGSNLQSSYVGGLNVNGNQTINSNAGLEMFTSFLRTNWTLTSGWDATNGGDVNINHSGAGVTTATLNTVAAVVGQRYQIIINNTYSGGAIAYSFGGVAGTSLAATQTYTDIIVATTTAGMIFTPTTAAGGSITSISIISQGLGGQLTINNDVIGLNNVTGLTLINNTTTPSATAKYQYSPQLSFKNHRWIVPESLEYTQEMVLGAHNTGDTPYDNNFFIGSRFGTGSITKSWIFNPVLGFTCLTNIFQNYKNFSNQTNAVNPTTGIILDNFSVSDASNKVYKSPILYFQAKGYNSVDHLHTYQAQVIPIADNNLSEWMFGYDTNVGLAIQGTFGGTTPSVRIANQLGIGLATGVSPQFTCDVNGSARIVGANSLILGGTTAGAIDYGWSISNVATDTLIIKPRTTGRFFKIVNSTNYPVFSLDIANQRLTTGRIFHIDPTKEDSNYTTKKVVKDLIAGKQNIIPNISDTSLYAKKENPFDTLNITSNNVYVNAALKTARMVTITASLELKFYNLYSGRNGKIEITVSSGTPTITMPTGSAGAGTFTTLDAGTYWLCWVYDGSKISCNINTYPVTW